VKERVPRDLWCQKSKTEFLVPGGQVSIGRREPVGGLTQVGDTGGPGVGGRKGKKTRGLAQNIEGTGPGPVVERKRRGE